MKFILLAILVFSTNSFAEVFTTNQILTSSTGQSIAPSKFEINILSLNPYDRTILLDINGKMLHAKMRRNIKEDSQTEDKNIYAFKTTILKNILLDGSGCEESESFQVELTIKVEVARDNSSVVNTLTNLVGNYEISSDSCHSYPRVKTIEYILN